MKALTKTLFACTLISLLVACNNKEASQDNTATSSPSPVSSPSPKATTGGKKINVTETEMKIQLSSAAAPKGPVDFVVTNKGKIAHEFVVLKTDLPDSKLPVKGGNLDEDAKGLKNVGEIGDEQLKSGATKTLSVNLAPGRYLLVCNVPGHFKAGMKARFTVK